VTDKTAATPSPDRPRWMSRWLIAAGAYNLLWGAAVVLFPLAAFELAGLEPPRYPSVWQCVGMIVGVYGVGYLAAATDPLRHWPIVLVGLLGKVFGPIGFVIAASRGELPWAFGLTILTNDLLWWIPFGLILARAFRTLGGRYTDAERPVPLGEAMARTTASDGRTLAEITADRPTLLLFLRHAGCIFCSEAAADLADELEKQDNPPPLVVVHLSDDAKMQELLERAGLGSALRVADPGCELYRAFELKRGSFAQLFGLRVFLAGVRARMAGHRVGMLQGDGFRLPGLFLVQGESILAADRAAHAGARLEAAPLLDGAPA